MAEAEAGPRMGLSLARLPPSPPMMAHWKFAKAALAARALSLRSCWRLWWWRPPPFPFMAHWKLATAALAARTRALRFCRRLWLWRLWRHRREAETEAEAEVGRRRASVVDARRRRKAEARAARRFAAEVVTAAVACAAAECTAAEHAAAEHAAAQRDAAERVGVDAAVAALERRVAAEGRTALAALAAVFEEGAGEDGRCAMSSAPGCGLEPRGCSSGADIGCTVALRLRCRAGRCRALPGRGRRRPHMRWRARRESYFIRCSPPVLLQQHRRGSLDVCLAILRPGG